MYINNESNNGTSFERLHINVGEQHIQPLTYIGKGVSNNT